MQEPTSEKIKFEIFLDTEYWDRPPYAELLIDKTQKFIGPVDNACLQPIVFEHELLFNQTHQLSIRRFGKTNDQVKENLNQTLSIDKILIDGINIRNIMWAYSWNEPDYPEPWATQQRELGVILEDKIPAETVFGHNCTWRLDFTSPFYRFIMDWLKK